MIGLFGGGGEKPTPKPEKKYDGPTEEILHNYLGATPTEKFGEPASYTQGWEKGKAQLKMTPPSEEPVSNNVDEEPATEPKNYLGIPGFGDKPERPKDEDYEREQAESERKARIELARQQLLQALQESDANVTIETNLTAGDGQKIVITLENIQKVF